MKQAVMILLTSLAMTTLASAQTTAPAPVKIDQGEFGFRACNASVKPGAKAGTFDFVPNVAIKNASPYKVERMLVRMFFYNQKHEDVHLAALLDDTGVHPATIPTGKWSVGIWPQDTKGLACQIMAVKLVGDPTRYVFHQ